MGNVGPSSHEKQPPTKHGRKIAVTTHTSSLQKSKIANDVATFEPMMRRADFVVRRHTGTPPPDQRHVPAHVPALCRPKCLIQRRCAGVTGTEREASHA